MLVFDALKAVCETNTPANNLVIVLTAYIIYSSVTVMYLMCINAINKKDIKYISILSVFQILFAAMLYFAYKILIDVSNNHPENNNFDFWFALLGVFYGFCLSISNIALLTTNTLKYFKKETNNGN